MICKSSDILSLSIRHRTEEEHSLDESNTELTRSVSPVLRPSFLIRRRRGIFSREFFSTIIAHICIEQQLPTDVRQIKKFYWFCNEIKILLNQPMHHTDAKIIR